VATRLAVPAPASRLHAVAWAALSESDSEPPPASGRELVVELADSGLEIVLCRATDIPLLVLRGVVDGGLTGYDVTVESMLATGATLDVRSLAPARSSFVCLATVPGRTTTRVVYTEYPSLTRSWKQATRAYRAAHVISVHGSVEGIVRVDRESAGVVLVTSGATVRANGLVASVPIIATDLCAIRSGRTFTVLGGRELDSLPQLSLPDFATLKRVW
jgi:ATP phosphoribosyltransferase